MKKKISLAAALIHSPRVLFLDEPFEGVDAIAAKTMKNTLQSMIDKGATIFLTSHVLDIVERLCSHVGIINHGIMVAQGSLEELRQGVKLHGTPGSEPGEPVKLTLEEIFVELVGAGHARTEQQLAWLTQ
jgi:ABC-2 type transport system ATP-binding protein